MISLPEYMVTVVSRQATPHASISWRGVKVVASHEVQAVEAVFSPYLRAKGKDVLASIFVRSTHGTITSLAAMGGSDLNKALALMKDFNCMVEREWSGQYPDDFSWHMDEHKKGR